MDGRGSGNITRQRSEMRTSSERESRREPRHKASKTRSYTKVSLCVTSCLRAFVAGTLPAQLYRSHRPAHHLLASSKTSQLDSLNESEELRGLSPLYRNNMRGTISH